MEPSVKNPEKVIIRDAMSTDMEAVWQLIYELADYEKAPEEVVVTPADLVRDGFSDAPCFFCKVAVVNDAIVGMALFFFKYSTWKGRTLYLDDIIVTQSFRRKGIGQKLFDEVRFFAAVNKCRRFEWQVLEWNADAIGFYRKNKARFDAEWINCKLIDQDYSSGL